VIEARMEDRRGLAVVLRRAKDGDRVRGCGLVLSCVDLDLAVDPSGPAGGGDEKHGKQAHGNKQSGFILS